MELNYSLIVILSLCYTTYLSKKLIQMLYCRFMEPLTNGEYPKTMQSLVGKRLPKFSANEIKLLRGSFDFIGLNYYTSYYATNAPELSEARPSYLTDSLVVLTSKCSLINIYHRFIRYQCKV